MKKHLLILSLTMAISLSGINLLGAEIDPMPMESMVIKYLTASIIIDGVADAAYPDYFALTRVLTFTAGQYSGPIDHSVNIRMGWRNEGIYIFADVSDDYAQGDLNWDQDGIELKINPDTSDDGPNYEWKEDALEIGIESAVDTMYRYYNPTLGYGAVKNGEIAAVGHRSGLPGVTYKIVRSGASYTIEAFLPWLFILPIGTTEDQVSSWRNKIMGFDIHAADNDGSGRDHCLIWDWDGSGTDADQSNINTLLLGYISFEQTTSLNEKISSKLLMYPNPAQDKVNFENLDNVSTLEFVNLFGQTVKTFNVLTKLESVNISGLSGYYIVKAKDSDRKVLSINKLIVR